MDKIKLYNWLKLLAIYFALLLIIYIAFLCRNLLFPFLLAVILTYILNPVADYFESWGIKRGAVVGVLFFSFILILALVLYFSMPSFLSELETLRTSAPKYFLNIKNSLQQIFLQLEEQFSFFPKGYLSNLLNEKYNSMSITLVSCLPGMVFKFINLIALFLLVLFTTFFLLKDGRQMRKTLISIVPNKYFELTLSVLHESNLGVGNYVRGQLTDCAIIGTLSIIGLFLIGFKYSLLIGILVGVMNMIPYLGPLTGMIVGFLLAVIDNHSIPMGLKVLLVLSIVKLIDDVLVNPIVVGKSVELHPLIIIICITIGGELLGIWGMLLIVPLFCALKATFEVLYEGIIKSSYR